MAEAAATPAAPAVGVEPGPILDPARPQRLASDPAASVWVSASAGTGKTKVLTDRVLRLLLAGTPPHRLLCLTFTKAAAAEMALRIHRVLAGWTAMDEAALSLALADLTGAPPDSATEAVARRLFAQVVDCPGGLKIQTLHAFCQSLLRRFPLEARLSPHFEVMDERSAREMLESARNHILQQAETAPDSALGKALRLLTAHISQPDFVDRMAELSRERGRLSHLLATSGGCAGIMAKVREILDLPPELTAEQLQAEACATPRVGSPRPSVAVLQMAVAALARGSGSDQERGATLANWLATPPEARPDNLVSICALFVTQENTIRKTLITKTALKHAAATPDLTQALTNEAAFWQRFARQQRALRVVAATESLLTVGQSLLETYQQAKAAQSRLDYDDLILLTRDLLERPGIAPWVLFKLDGGLDHLLIDEAQDTNPEQWQVVARLTEEFHAGAGARTLNRTVFAVGDEKQSIYSFQRADPAAFAAMQACFRTRARTVGQTWRDIALNVSFRSVAAVLKSVDAVFATPAARDGVALTSDAAIRHLPWRRGAGGQVEVWPTVQPEESPQPSAWELPLRRSRQRAPETRLATAIADTILDWLSTATPLPARGRPIRPGDVLVLVRRRNRFVNDLIRALKVRQVPVAGSDRMVLTDQLVVMDLLALAEFLLLPEDDLTLAAILRGPLLGVSEDALFTLAHHRPGSLWAALQAMAASGAEPWPAIHDWLAHLRTRVDLEAPYELFADVLERPCPADSRSGRRAFLARLGAEAQDPLDEFLAATLAFERLHPPALQTFLHWLKSSEAESKRELAADQGEVRILTVHGAKGLQAPIVFLPDTVSAPRQSPAILWPDADCPVPLFALRRDDETAPCAQARARADQRRDQEYRRLLYVALTRAEDRLIVCGWEGRKAPAPNNWHALVNQALAADPACERWEFPGELPADWTGTGLRLVTPQTAAAPPPPPEPEENAAALPMPAWLTAPPPDEPRPPRPLAPSRLMEDDEPLQSPLGADGGERFRRGLLVHRLLQRLPDAASAVRAALGRQILSQETGLPLDETQREDLLRSVLAILDDSALAPLFGPGSRAEVPIVGWIHGHGVSGQVDRLAVLDSAVWIVDYKTNRNPPRHPDQIPSRTWTQMALYYGLVLQMYPDRPVRCALIWTDGPQWMELPASSLTAILEKRREL